MIRRPRPDSSRLQLHPNGSGSDTPRAEAVSNGPGIVPVASPGVRDVRSIVPLSRPVLGPSSGSRHTTGLLPDFYRPVGCHYRISPRFLAIACEALQKGFETLESPLVTGFYAAF